MQKIGILASNREWRDNGRVIGYPHRHIVAGLKAIGHRPRIINDHGAPITERTMSRLFPGGVEAVWIWNAWKGERKRLRAELQAAGAVVLTMEHAFFHLRRERVQIDHQGFSQMSSWCRQELFDSPTPKDSMNRLRQMWREPVPCKPRSSGYVLVILQVPNDGQLFDSEIQTSGPLVRAVEASAPEGVEIRVRAHPVSPWSCGTKGRARMTEAKTLYEDITGARFCVTINSTAGVQAIGMGCPVLCLGPAMYATAGVAMQSSVVGLPQAIQTMLDGWSPSPSRAVNFLCHLACRQWTFAELAQGEVLKKLLEAARECSPS